MCMPPLWPKRICRMNRPRPSRAMRSTICRSGRSGCRRNISMTPRVRIVRSRSRGCRNIIRPAPNSRSCAIAAAISRRSSRRARRWSNSAPARPPKSGCCWRIAPSAPTSPSIFPATSCKAQADALRKDFPGLDVYPVAADFTAPFALPEADRRHAEGRILSGLDARQFRAARGLRLPAQRPRKFWAKARR